MKVLTHYVKTYMPQLLHPTQYGFIEDRNMLHAGCASCSLRTTCQELIMVQLDLGIAHGHVNCLFISKLMHTMGVNRQKQPTTKHHLNQQNGRGLSWQMSYARMRRGQDLPHPCLILYFD